MDMFRLAKGQAFMCSLRTILLMLVTAAVTGCAGGEAFVDRAYMTRSVKKQKIPGYNGVLTICYDSGAPREKRDQLASEACEVYGLKAVLSLEQKWQCRLTVPHMASYACVDPDMHFANGTYVNPFSVSQVNAWKQQQRQQQEGETAE
jgi:hypothetical protein